MSLANSRFVHQLSAARKISCRLARVLPRALPLLAGFWTLDVHATDVFAVKMDPSLQPNYYFTQPSGDCSVLESSESAFTISCSPPFLISSRATIEIKQRGTNASYGTVYVDDESAGRTFVFLRDNAKYFLASCGTEVGSCNTPSFMDSEAPPSPHYDHEDSVITVKKVCASYSDPGCLK